MRIGFLLYPTAGVRVDEDSSFWIIHELIRRGHQVFHFESSHLFVESGQPRATVYRSRTDAKKGFLPAPLSEEPLDLCDLDVIFVRKEPPFDNQYLHALQILSLLSQKVFIMNDPHGIAMFNEKLSVLHFPGLIAETMVTDDPATAARFIRRLKQPVVIKPLHDKAGAGILSTQHGDKNLPSMLAMVTGPHKNKVMIQRFIHSAGASDKRLLILNGRLVGAFARKPSPSDFRSNLSVGGTMHKTKISPQDQKIVAALADFLLENGLYFVGVDVLGGFLIEINVTSPSGVPEINHLYGVRLQEKIADFIESRV